VFGQGADIADFWELRYQASVSCHLRTNLVRDFEVCGCFDVGCSDQKGGSVSNDDMWNVFRFPYSVDSIMILADGKFITITGKPICHVDSLTGSTKDENRYATVIATVISLRNLSRRPDGSFDSRPTRSTRGSYFACFTRSGCELMDITVFRREER
jgi:hypothetical protein